MTDLLNEFDEKRYPHRYRITVSASGLSRARRWLGQAVDRLHLDAGFATQLNHVPTGSDQVETADIGIGLINEGDYALLIAEFDRLGREDQKPMMIAQSKWEPDLTELHPHGELLEAYQEQLEWEQPQEHENTKDDFGLEM